MHDLTNNVSKCIDKSKKSQDSKKDWLSLLNFYLTQIGQQIGSEQLSKHK